jgi:hypothetical protein
LLLQGEEEMDFLLKGQEEIWFLEYYSRNICPFSKILSIYSTLIFSIFGEFQHRSESIPVRKLLF